jgi:hypothetical protein
MPEFGGKTKICQAFQRSFIKNLTVKLQIQWWQGREYGLLGMHKAAPLLD